MKKRNTSAMGSIQLSRRAWLYGVLAIGVLAAVFYFSWSGSFLGARLTGPDVASAYTPLVRHLLASQTHCYDNGSTFCERYMASGGQKEFTVAYLFQQRPRNLGTNQIFGCFNPRTKDYLLTTNRNECQAKRMTNIYLYGYTATTDNFETSTQLFRCYSRDAANYLVTDDRKECELAAHTDEIVELGWAAAAGHLPQRRLQGLCGAVNQAKVLQDSYNSYCGTLAGISNSVSSVTPTPTTSVAPSVSWQNRTNKYDVNGDSHISPIDALVVVNALDSKGPHKLVGGVDAVPPYIDVNGDGSLSPADSLLVAGCVQAGGSGSKCQQ